MQLNLTQRSLARFFLQLVTYYWPGAHWSFGDAQMNAGIALPLVGIAQQYCKPGTDTGAAAYRQLQPGFEYIIEGKNAYLDLKNWKYKQPGMNRNYDVCYFLKDHKLRVIVYAVPKSTKSGSCWDDRVVLCCAELEPPTRR